MRVVFLIGSILFISWYGVVSGHSGRPRHHDRHHDQFEEVPSGFAAPTDDGYVPVPIEAAAVVAKSAPIAKPESAPVAVPACGPAALPSGPPDSTPAEIVPAGYRKETTDTISNHTSLASAETSTKDKVKVITKHRKDGSTVTIIKDKSKTKTKKDLLTDDYNQSNHTLTEGGVEDSSSLTTDHQHELKETDVKKKVDKEIIVTDKYGNVVSDTHKIKEKEKVKKKEKDLQTQSYVHTVKSAPPPVVAVDPTEAPPPVPADPSPSGC